MTDSLDPVRSDPHDPLSPRPDDPRIGRWWWARRLHERRGSGRPLFFRWPIALTAAMLVLALFAFMAWLVWSR